MTQRFFHTRPLAALLAVSLLAPAPLAAQEAGPDGQIEEGLDLFERGADLFMRGLLDELRPQLEELGPQFRDLAEGVGPMLTELLSLVDELDAYHPPERLPNGDIILRRKVPSERESLPEEAPLDEPIDL